MSSTVMVRHGNKEPLKGKIDPDLTQLGKLQSIKTGLQNLQSYKPEFWQNHVAVVSPFKRTVQTALLSLAQVDWNEGQVPQIILDPNAAETIADNTCICSTRDELLQWYDHGLMHSLHEGVEEAVLEGLIKPENADQVYDRLNKLVDAMDISAIQNSPVQEVWPTNGSLIDGYETPQDAQMRLDELKSQHGDKLILFTHSTFIAAVMHKKLATEFDGAACDENIDAPVAQMQRQIAECGVYRLERGMDALFVPNHPYPE